MQLNTERFKCTFALRHQIDQMSRGIMEACPEFNPQIAALCATYALDSEDVLCGAVMSGNLELFKDMLDIETNILSALKKAMQYGQLNILQYILEELVYECNLSELLRFSGSAQIIEYLVGRGADASLALEVAIRRGHLATFDALLPRADMHRIGRAMSIAVRKGNEPIVMRMIRAGAIMTRCGSAVSTAAVKDDVDMLEILLKAGAPVGPAAFFNADGGALDCLLDRASPRELRNVIDYIERFGARTMERRTQLLDRLRSEMQERGLMPYAD